MELLLAGAAVVSIPLTVFVLLYWGVVGGTPRPLAERHLRLDEARQALAERQVAIAERKAELDLKIGEMELRQREMLMSDRAHQREMAMDPQVRAYREARNKAAIQPETGAVPPLFGARRP